MDFWDVIHRRHSVRHFDPHTDLTNETIETIVSAALEAPSAGNCQPWSFIVVRDPSLRHKLVHAAFGQTFLAEAPVVIVVCSEATRSTHRYGERGRQLYCLQDTAAATEHLLLAATALGLGSCWVGAFDEEAVSTVLALPDSLRPVAMVPLGHAATPSSRETSRRAVTDVLSYR